MHIIDGERHGIMGLNLFQLNEFGLRSVRMCRPILQLKGWAKICCNVDEPLSELNRAQTPDRIKSRLGKGQSEGCEP